MRPLWASRGAALLALGFVPAPPPSQITGTPTPVTTQNDSAYRIDVTPVARIQDGAMSSKASSCIPGCGTTAKAIGRFGLAGWF